MESGSILSADVLDIIFDARNKEYGAYDLRKNYQRRLVKAVIVTSSFVVLTCVTYVVLGSMKPSKEQLIVDGTVTLKNIAPPAEPRTPPPPPPPPPPKLPPPDFKMVKNMVPIIVKDDVPVDEMPEQKDLDNVLIGAVNRDGKDYDGTQESPVDEAKGIVEAPKKQDEVEKIFLVVEIESKYPGGMSAWAAYLNRNLTFPQEAVDIDVQGTVTIQFIVDADGNVSDVTAISGPQELRAAAVAAIKKSGKWEPAIQNGRKVKSYKKQPITFKLAEG